MRCWLWYCTGPAASPRQLPGLQLCLLLTGSAAKSVIDDLLAPDEGDSIWMPEVSPPPDELPPEATPEPAAEGLPAGGAQQHSPGLAAAEAATDATLHQPAPGAAAAAAAGVPGQPSGSQAGPGAQQEAAAAQAAIPAEQASDQGTQELDVSDAETEDYGASPAMDAHPTAGTSDAAAAGNGTSPAGKEVAKLTSGAARHDPYEFNGTEVQQDAVPDASRPAPAAAPHQVGHWGVFGGMVLLAGHHVESQWQQRSRPVARGVACAWC